MKDKIIALFKKWMQMFIKFLQGWSEAWALIPAIGLFFFLPTLLHKVDPTAGSFDIGYISKFVLALVFMLAIHACVWIGIKFNYPTLFKHGDDGFDSDWKSLASWQRILAYFSVAAFLSLLFVLLIITL